MTLKIVRISEKHATRIRLSCALRCEQLSGLRTEIERDGRPVILDLGDLDLVDIYAVWFLNACEAHNVKLVHCAPYVRE